VPTVPSSLLNPDTFLSTLYSTIISLYDCKEIFSGYQPLQFFFKSANISETDCLRH